MPISRIFPIDTTNSLNIVNNPTQNIKKIDKWNLKKGEPDPLLETLKQLSSPGCLPFSKEQEAIFSNSYQISLKTRKYLNLHGYAIIVALGMIAGFSGIRMAKFCGYSESSVANDLIPFTITTLTGVGLGVASMIFTGTFPDQKSDSADAKERECLQLEKQFNEAALKLVSLYWSKKPDKYNLAIDLSHGISKKIHLLEEQLRDALQIPFGEISILLTLKEAVHYIESKGEHKLILSNLCQLIKIEKLIKKTSFPLHLDR
jgi:hypothetical protein